MNKTWLDELCELIQIEVGHRATPKIAKRYLIGLYKVILNQLKINGKIHIPNFGTFELRKREGREIKVGDVVNGGVKYIYVEPRYFIEFKTSSALDRNINENKFQMINKKKKTLKKSKDEIPPIESAVADLFMNSVQRQKNNSR